MYGYIRPLRGELRVADYERYQAAYCGLCHSLQKRYGFLSRFLVSYDLSFLALLLEDESGSCRRFCPLHPVRKRRCLQGRALDAAADCCVVLFWRKLEDELRDSHGIKRLLARLARLLYRRPYRRAREAQPELDAAAERELTRLARLEEEKTASLDAAADCFAQLLAACAELAGTEPQRRILRELLYHVGRSIYILDAVDDFPDDVRQGGYNPLRLRYGDALDDTAREEIRATLNLSQHVAVSALELMERNGNTPITENILILGLPAVTGLVLSGEWKNKKRLARQWRRRDREAELL